MINKKKATTTTNITSLYDNWPPHQYIYVVAQKIPKAILLYIRLWQLKNSNNQLHILRKNVDTIFLTDVYTFRKYLIELCSTGLVSFEDDKENELKIYKIELTDWSENDEQATN